MASRLLSRLGISVLASVVTLLMFEVVAHVLPGVLPAAVRYELGLVKPRVVVDQSGERIEEAVNSFDHNIWRVRRDAQGFRLLPSDKSIKERTFGVVVGDSMSFCWGVEATACWVTQLSHQTNRSFTDLGLPGTGSVSHYRVMNEYLTNSRVRVVFWQFFLNDFHEDWELMTAQAGTARANRGLATLLLEGHAFLQGHSAAYSLIKMVKNRTAVVNAGGLGYVLRPAWVYNLAHTYTDFSNSEVAAGLRSTEDSLDRAAQLASQHKARFVVVVAPAKERVYWERLRGLRIWPAGFDPGRADEAILEFCRRRGIAVVDLFDDLHREAINRADLYFQYDDHWTPAGNSIVAAQLHHYLSKEGLLADQ